MKFVSITLAILCVFGTVIAVPLEKNTFASWSSLESIGESLSGLVYSLWDYQPKSEFDLPTQHSYDNRRKDLIEKTQESYFTVDVSELSEKEKQVDEYMSKLRDDIVQGDHTPLLLPFYESKKIVENSKIYDVLQKMPKGAQLHSHVAAAFPMDVFINLTYNDNVYFNMEDNRIIVLESGEEKSGYFTCNSFRKNWQKEGTFDEYLRNLMMLEPDVMETKESNDIWKYFQDKFSIASGMVRYPPYYKQLLRATCLEAIKDKAYILEVRSSVGSMFDGDIDAELNLYKEVIEEVKQEHPYFELRLIISSSKVEDKQVIQRQLQYYEHARKTTNFVTGFDLVKEEDVSPPLYYYKDILLEAKQNAAEGTEFKFFFHAGESTSRNNENLFDALLMGTERIGHGLAITKHPYLIEMVRERDIGYEICPISNFILGYTLDLRWHPIRDLMVRGVAVTISSDDPTFWGYNKLSLDFVYAFLAWELDLKDLKQLAINSIKQSSITDSVRISVFEKFNKDWSDFVNEFAVSTINSF